MATSLIFPVTCSYWSVAPVCHFNYPLQWRHNGHDSVSNHQPHDCLLNRLFRRRSKKTSKLCVTGLCAGNSPGTGEFPAQMASNAENISIWWRHHAVVQSVSPYLEDFLANKKGVIHHRHFISMALVVCIGSYMSPIIKEKWPFPFEFCNIFHVAVQYFSCCSATFFMVQL